MGFDVQKNRLKFGLLMLLATVLSACVVTDTKQLQRSLQQLTAKPLSKKDIATGLKQALQLGTERVVVRLGKANAYLEDRYIHIALPQEIQRVHAVLQRIGLGHYTRDLETRMNQAAALSARQAGRIFRDAISKMRWQDVYAIYRGKDDAATRYFRKQMTPALREMMRPVITQALNQTGAMQAWYYVLDQYRRIPYVPPVRYDVHDYVMTKAIDGLFFYMAKEEAAIRKDPAKRTTALLKRMFGNG